MYKDSTLRVLPSLRIERISGGYQVTLQDHASHQQCSVNVVTLKEIPKALESLLGAGGEAFRPFESQKVKDVTKRKKAGGT
jgi:hypothetical protein